MRRQAIGAGALVCLTLSTGCAKSYVIPVVVADKANVPHARLIVVNDTDAALTLEARSECCERYDCPEVALPRSIPAGQAEVLRASLRGRKNVPTGGDPATRSPDWAVYAHWSDYVGPSRDDTVQPVLWVNRGAARRAELILVFDTVAPKLFAPWRVSRARLLRPTFVVHVDGVVDRDRFEVAALETCADAEAAGVGALVRDECPG